MFKKKSSFRTLFPRIENLFVATRLIAIVTIALWVGVNWRTPTQNTLAAAILAGCFAAHLTAFYLISGRRDAPIPTIYKLTFGFDVVFISLLTYFTGGTASDFYLLYYPLIGFASYYLGLESGIIVAFMSTAMYLLVNSQTIRAAIMIDLVIRMGLAWLYAFAVGMVAKHLRHSEEKLLKLLDTLNERTTELERTQIQIETIYETSRSLGEIYNLEEVYHQVNHIGETILGYPMCGILLLDESRTMLQVVAVVENGIKKIFAKPINISLSGVTGDVIKTGRTSRIADLETVRNYLPGLKNARSEMAVPMVARGKIIGVLNAESTRLGAFSERDEKLFSILAASAGLAIDNARMHKQISDLTISDELTGIYNYRYFVLKLEEERRRAARYNLPLSLIMLDLDWFKKTNDSYGHEVGNIVLREIVGTVRNCIRDTDTFCRYGGEEFIIILPQTVSQEAAVLAERIRASVEVHDFGLATGIPRLKITVSIGTTSFPDNGLSPQQLVQTVDMALYRAKGAGKNTVCTV